MTEYELIDALGTYSSGMQAWTATYFSGATAYLTVEHWIWEAALRKDVRILA